MPTNTNKSLTYLTVTKKWENDFFFVGGGVKVRWTEEDKGGGMRATK